MHPLDNLLRDLHRINAAREVLTERFDSLGDLVELDRHAATVTLLDLHGMR